MEDVQKMVQTIPDVSPHHVKNVDARHQYENCLSHTSDTHQMVFPSQMRHWPVGTFVVCS